MEQTVLRLLIGYTKIFFLQIIFYLAATVCDAVNRSAMPQNSLSCPQLTASLAGNTCGFRHSSTGCRSQQHHTWADSTWHCTNPFPRSQLAASAVWWLAWWPLVLKIAGSNPTEAVEKIHSMPSFGGEVKPSVPCRRFAACKRTLWFAWKSESQAKLTLRLPN
jgi:hypothetical protein